MAYNGVNDLGKTIKQIRNRKKLKREELAELADTSPRYLARIENEGRIPSYRVVCNVIRALGVSADEVIYPESSKPTTAKQELINYLHQCDEEDVLVALATVRALYYRKIQLANRTEVEE